VLHATSSVQLAGSNRWDLGGHKGRTNRHKSHGGRSFSTSDCGPASGCAKAAYSLKHMEQSSPPYSSRMDQGVQVRLEPRSDISIPRIPRRIQRHIDDYRSSQDILARHAAPEPAIVRISAIVSHCEIAIVRYPVRKFCDFITHGRLSGGCGLAGTGGVVLLQLLPADPHCAFTYVHHIARQSDDPLHIIRLRWIEGWLENNDLL